MRLTLPNHRAFIVIVLSALLAFSGCNKSNDTSAPLIPAVTTSAIIVNPSATGAQVNGSVTNFISGTLTAYGFCWSATNPTPTIADTKTTLTTANVVRFASDLTGLTANTLYYIRAYATSVSSNSTEYGTVVQFKTPTTTYSLKATTSTFAGTTTEGYTEGPKTSALFNSPKGIVMDAAGNFYIADSFNNAIRKITAAGVVSTLAGNATPGFANGTGAAASFYSPQYIAIDATGNLYVTDVGNNAIRKITPAGVVTTLAGGNGVGYADGTGTAVKFFSPAGLAADAAGNVYVADKGNNVIRKITSAGVTSTLAGNRTAGFGDAVGTAAYFNAPTGLTVDATGNVYVADLGNSAIRVIVAADGTTTTYLGGPTTALADALDAPVALAFDKSNNLFITDAGGRILQLAAANKILWNIAGNAKTAGYTEGAGTAAKFNSPQGITTDAAGAIYVADYNNNMIRKLTVTTTP